MRGRPIVAGILALALLYLAGGQPVRAQDNWPNGQVIKIVVPFAPGGTYDIVARLLVQPLGAALKTSVIIENKPGAGTNLGTDMVVRATPDGLTLLMGGIPNAINETLYPKLNFKVQRDLVGVTLVASLPNVLVVNPDVPAKTLAEFVALNKAKPGEITFASGGIGTSPHLCAVMFGLEIGAANTHVPYRGSAPASQDLIAGQVQAQFDSVGSAIGQIQAGKLRALAVTGDHRAALLPEVPTMAEGGVSNFVVTSWMGLMAPAGTPRPIVDRIATEVDKILASDEIKKLLADRGYETMGGGADKFAKYLDDDIALWAKVVKASGATVN
jgi:tripartite-type tricarboxylate transporter receptor subunit TctC